jgi:hypothetical protein
MRYYRSTEYKCMFTFFSLLYFSWITPLLFPFTNPLNGQARLKNWPAPPELPDWLAPRARHFWSARKTRHFGPPERFAIFASQIDPPVYPPPPPAQNSQAGHGPLAAPPPPNPNSVWRRRRGGGGGGRPGPPEHPKQVLYFTAPCNG